MKKFMVLSLALTALSVCSCDNDDEKTPEEVYDGVELGTVLKSECLGDVYGQGVNVINLQLAAGEIHSDGAMGFEGEGTCLVLALFDEMTEDWLPSEGNYTPADWNTMELAQRFDPGFCEYQQEYGEWLTNGTYAVTIDKEGKQTYTAFTSGSLTLTIAAGKYEIDALLKDESGKEFKARYKGDIAFEVQKPEEGDRYQYEEQTQETLSPVVNSVDIHNFGKDFATGLVNYKILVWAENNLITQFILYMPESTTGMISDGKYGVSDEPAAGCVLAGYYENENFIGSYSAQWDSSYSHLQKVWYLTSGELSVKTDGNTVELGWNGSSAYGSSVNIDYKGEYNFTDLTAES